MQGTLTHRPDTRYWLLEVGSYRDLIGYVLKPSMPDLIERLATEMQPIVDRVPLVNAQISVRDSAGTEIGLLAIDGRGFITAGTARQEGAPQ